MPIKFSELTTKGLEESSKIIGLYADNSSGSGSSNCIINAEDFAKQTTLETVNSEALHKAGVETVTGSKTFDNVTRFNQKATFITSPNIEFDNPSIGLMATNITKGTTPSEFCGAHIKFFDKDSKLLSYVEGAYNTSGQKYIALVARDGSASGTNSSSMGVGYDSANLIYTWAPKPRADSNDSNIATTNWIRTLLTTMYPVGSIYIGTQKSCPMASIILGSTWELVAANKALWTGSGSNANTTIEAGLPNIKDNFYFVDTYYGSIALAPDSDAGLIKYNSKTTSTKTNRSDTDGTTTSRQKYVFDASQVNSIFGKSTTVQPPAYVVNVWRRTA